MKKVDLKDFELVGPAMHIPKTKTLVMGDLHVGSDEELAASGAFSPLIGLSEIVEMTKNLIKITKPKQIILLGDLEVHFGSIPYKQKKAILDYIDMVKEKCKVVLIKGNHDKFISKILENTNTEFANYYEEGDFFFCHGDQTFETKKKYVVIGHEHPAISIDNEIRREKYKCTIISEYKKSKLIVLPSLNQTSIGTDVLKEKLISPYLTSKVLKKAIFFAIEKMEIYPFGDLYVFKK